MKKFLFDTIMFLIYVVFMLLILGSIVAVEILVPFPFSVLIFAYLVFDGIPKAMNLFRKFWIQMYKIHGDLGNVKGN